MRPYNFINALCILFVFVLFGCDHSKNTTTETMSEDDHLIQITHEQFTSNAMKIGELSSRIFEDKVRCNGYIIAPANGMAMVSTQIAGIVENVNYCPGEYVKKGEILCTLSSLELIILQQDYAEASARLKQLHSDYERSNALFQEKIGAEKDLISKESEYKAMKARHHSLKLQLELLKLKVSKIEDGDLYANFPIKAPISGYITSQEVVLGQFIEQQKQLIEIVDIDQLQLELNIFENDLSKLKMGQSIQFNLLGESPASHKAKLLSIGKSINPESKTIQCIAQLKADDETNFINRSFAEADIIVNNREANALPNEAIVKSGSDYYIFVVEKKEKEIYYLRKVKVILGEVSKDYTEVIVKSNLKNIVVSGIYNLQIE